MFNLLKKKIVNKYPFLGKWIQYKFNLEWEESEKDHSLGGSYDYEKIDLIDNGDWENKLKEVLTELEFFELQHGALLDTMGCTGFGTLKGIQSLAYVKYNEIWNKAERFTNKVSGTTKSGNSISRVFETIRKTHGVVNEKDWGWDRNTFNWNQYYSNIPVNILDKGKNWLKDWQFNYEVVGNDHASIKEALKKSPVGVGVYAWYKRGDKYYSAGNANHWTLIIKQNWGENYVILDSYKPYIKILDWNFRFSFPRAFYLTKKDTAWNIDKINKLKNDGYKYIIRAEKNGEFSKIAENCLEYVKDLREIANEIADDLKQSPENINLMLKYLTQEKKLKWLDEKGYYDLKK